MIQRGLSKECNNIDWQSLEEKKISVLEYIETKKKKSMWSSQMMQENLTKFDIHPCKHSQQTKGSILNLMTSSKHLSAKIT